MCAIFMEFALIALHEIVFDCSKFETKPHKVDTIMERETHKKIEAYFVLIFSNWVRSKFSVYWTNFKKVPCSGGGSGGGVVVLKGL